MISRTSLRTDAVALGDILDGNGDVRHARIGDDTGLKESQAERSGSLRQEEAIMVSCASAPRLNAWSGVTELKRTF